MRGCRNAFLSIAFSTCQVTNINIIGLSVCLSVYLPDPDYLGREKEMASPRISYPFYPLFTPTIITQIICKRSSGSRHHRTASGSRHRPCRTR